MAKIEELNQEKINENNKNKNKEKTQDNENEEGSKLTQITFNNFDGEKIEKHNEYLRISEKEENSEDEEEKNDQNTDNIQKEDQKDNTLENQKVSHDMSQNTQNVN